MEKITGRISRNVPEGTKCTKCQHEQAILIARTEAVCGSCYTYYIGSKLSRGLSDYKVSSKKIVRRLLLAHSFGPASTALLHFLDTHSQSQLDRAGRTGYELLVVFVDEQCIDSARPSAAHLDVLRQKYPKFEYKSIGIEDIYNYEHAIGDEVSGQDEHSQEVQNDSSAVIENTSTMRLQNLIQSLPTRNSQMDIIELLRSRLIMETAKTHDCDTVLYGHTATRLAEKILSEITKGRGRSIPWQVTDGPTPYGLTIQHPLRDVHNQELDIYIELLQLEEICITNKVMKSLASSRNQSLDEIIKQYFKGVDENFPSVIANVVKTAGKLVTTTSVGAVEQCKICALPKDVDIAGWIKDEDQDDNFWSMKPIVLGPGQDKKEGNEHLCYGCRRTTLGAANFVWPL